MSPAPALDAASSVAPAADVVPAEEARPGVLFVDDDEAVLAGLRTSLRRLRTRYRFFFARGAEEALLMVGHEPIDVIVTDARMPGMNGVELLKRVKADHPGIVRYVLSGEAERRLLLEAVPVTQRWLTKPCSQDVLVDALDEAVRHRALLAAPDILAVLGDVNALPSPPPLYRELVAVLGDPEASVDQIAELIAGDAAVAARLLQWANSALAGGNRVSDLRTAVVRLGFTTVSHLVLSADLIRRLDPLEVIPGMGVDDLRLHLRSLSTMASGLSVHHDRLEAATAGGLVEIGLLLEASHLPERLHTAYAHAEEAGISLVEAEAELYGVTHCDLGGHLLSVWGLPSPLVLAVERAHQPPPAEPAPLPCAQAVQAARLAVQRLPYFASFGRPHHDRVPPGLEAAVEQWVGTIGAGRREGDR